MPRFADFVPIAYCNSYGGRGYSDFFFAELKLRVNAFATANSLETVPNSERQWITAEIIEEFGSAKCSGKYANMCIVYIPKRFEGFDRIREYDGLEDVYIDTEAYKMADINVITFNEVLTSDQKVERLKLLLQEKLSGRVYSKEDVIELLAVEEAITTLP